MFKSSLFYWPNGLMPWSTSYEMSVKNIVQKVVHFNNKLIKMIEKEIPLTLPDMIRRHSILSHLMDFNQLSKRELIPIEVIDEQLQTTQEECAKYLNGRYYHKLYRLQEELQDLSSKRNDEYDSGNWLNFFSLK